MTDTNETGLSAACPVCQSSATRDLIEMTQVPAHCNLLWPTPEGAVSVPRGDIRLSFCSDCHHVFNRSFDPALMAYTQDYENSLHFSAHFQQFATALAQGLIERYDLHDKDIVEIGAGKGDFLIMLCEMGSNRGVGFDPSYVPGAARETTAAVDFILDFYSEKYTDYKADFIACRHVLEHIQDPDAFIANVRRAVNNRSETIVYFEVPNVLFTLRDLGIWDIIYEHCAYFSPYSLAQVFQQNGFRTLAVTPVFGSQFLTIEAALKGRRPDLWQPDQQDRRRMVQDVAAFADSFNQKVSLWQSRLADMAAAGQKAVVWGAGSKGVTFMNTLKAGKVIEYVVDINPRKQGMHVAGAGQKIVPPEFLRTYQPDVVIIMNANYKDEIGRAVTDLGVTAEILVA